MDLINLIAANGMFRKEFCHQCLHPMQLVVAVCMMVPLETLLPLGGSTMPASVFADSFPSFYCWSTAAPWSIPSLMGRIEFQGGLLKQR